MEKKMKTTGITGNLEGLYTGKIGVTYSQPCRSCDTSYFSASYRKIRPRFLEIDVCRACDINSAS